MDNHFIHPCNVLISLTKKRTKINSLSMARGCYQSSFPFPQGDELKQTLRKALDEHQQAVFRTSQKVNIFSSVTHIVPAATTQCCSCGTRRQPQTICKQVRWLCSNTTLQKQAVSQMWPAGHSTPTPALDQKRCQDTPRDLKEGTEMSHKVWKPHSSGSGSGKEKTFYHIYLEKTG